ncbi:MULTISPECIES: esterase-like activity of phytase family protein [unclassified Streptomyces]|uniref:caspase, EACC1-associated type n=1 Tax=unclassified Streptomyces TaxID=2593676 RepID=UPI00336A9D8A
MTGGDDAAPQSQGEPGRMDPKKSACVLIGVSTYKHLPDLPSVPGNLNALKRLLADDSVWGLHPDRIKPVADPQTVGDMTDPIYDAIERATDTLVVYYAGHGLQTLEDEQLYLTASSSRRNRSETTLAYRRLRQILESCRDRVKRRVVILDCCHSGQALDGMAVSDSALADTELKTKGSYVLTATARDEKAVADSTKPYTAFSGELIKILRTGDPRHPDRELLSLDDIHKLLVHALDLRSLPQPHKQDQDGVGTLPFVRNRASRHPPRPPEYWTRRRRAWAGLTLATTLAAGAAGGHWAPELWRSDSGGAAIPGPCGEESRATLLAVSDQLDEPGYDEFQGSEVAGLSALALADGSGRAYAVRDETPAQIFTLSLGSPGALPGKLDPRVTDVQGIYEPDGSKFTTFDGEGLVVEKGGRTALVSSEKGPAIRRIRLSDGKQVGGDLPLPKTFYPPPDGVAESTRNVESLAVTPDGKLLYAGMEAPLLGDEDVHGRHQLRIERYRGSSGGRYVPDRQIGYQTEEGLYLSELVAVGPDRLLALERGYIRGLGNGVRVYEVDLRGAANLIDTDRLVKDDSDRMAHKTLLVDLADCPPGDVRTDDDQQNPLLDNVEGMALGPVIPAGGAKVPAGSRALYLISDNNSRSEQTTRLYALAVSLRGP